MQVQILKKNRHLSNQYFLDDFQWKRENRNLQKFIQNQHFGLFKPFQSRQFLTENSKKNQKLFLMRSLENLNLKEKTKTKRVLSPQILILKPNENFLTESQLEIQSNKKQQELVNSRFSIIINQKHDIEVQTSQEDLSLKRKKSVQQNNCMKDLIQILEKQVLNFTKTISKDQQEIRTLNSEIKGLKQKLTEQNQINQLLNDKLKKETELNQCMEYIIAELNQKVKTLIDKNIQLQELVQEFSANFEQKTIEGFIDSQSSLSMNSQLNKNCKQTDMFKHNDSICQQTASNIFPQEYQNWSCSILQMSSFNKTPNKVLQVPLRQDELRYSPPIQKLSKDQIIEEIMTKHQIEINKLNQKIKYYEIQNLMLKRKKQLSEKNNQEVNQLKTKIQKLSQQNKIIKLIQNKTNKKLQTSNPKIKKSTRQNKIIEVNNLQSHPLQDIQTKRIPTKIQKSQISITNTENNPNNVFDSKEKQRTKSLKNEKQNSKRKNPLQRKFVRKQQKSPRSSKLKSDEELQVSLSLSPERI